MTEYQYKTFIIYEQEYSGERAIAEGVILPSKQVALVWRGENGTFVVFPDIDSFLNIQNKIPNRNVHFGGFSPDGILLTTFTLVRALDVTGISGNGIIAYGASFGDHSAVLQWAGEQSIPSIAFYPKGIKQIESIHGHGGKTKIEFDYPVPSW